MTGLKDLLASERGWFAIFTSLIAVGLCWRGMISGTQCLAFLTIQSTTLIASKTATGIAEMKNQTVPVAIAFETQSKDEKESGK